MCIYLFYQIRKWRRNRNARNVHTQSEERRQVKQDPLCEHQLADAARVNNNGVVAGTHNGLKHEQPHVRRHGPKRCSECMADKKRARVYRWKVLVSLVIPNIMASMDLTIIATALPIIASHFCESR
jgi:hypothetical protein